MNYNYKRRATRQVKVGNVAMGANNPVRLQSMTSTRTADVVQSLEQTLKIAAAGGEIVRLTAQGVREAEAMGELRHELDQAGCSVPLVADIHFNPKAAFAAAPLVEKVRINPGNFVDPGRVFKNIEYTPEQYQGELDKIENALVPLLDLCKAHNTALRIGVNHGSLSDRIMSRYGNTPAGMVESAMEFLRVCRCHGFNDVVISIKASNVLVMVETVKLLAHTLSSEGMDYPLHLGVTEAGDGEDGRIKSAVGIGTLLSQGLGDTIRVSLCEDPECEIPVARALVDYVQSFDVPESDELVTECEAPKRNGAVKVVGTDLSQQELNDNAATITNKADVKKNLQFFKDHPKAWAILSPSHPNKPAHFLTLAAELAAHDISNPVMLKTDDDVIKASVDLGWPLLQGVGDGVWTGDNPNLALSLLQAARIRFSKTEFIACPSCGRTMFDIQPTLHRVKEATAHLPGLKIAVMGCIVNGPGEMADADYGYVGSSVGRVNLYKGKQCIEKNIPQDQGVDRLIELIKENGDWKEPV